MVALSEKPKGVAIHFPLMPPRLGEILRLTPDHADGAFKIEVQDVYRAAKLIALRAKMAVLLIERMRRLGAHPSLYESTLFFVMECDEATAVERLQSVGVDPGEFVIRPLGGNA